jgi:SAM-dependent methyltransferase
MKTATSSQRMPLRLKVESILSLFRAHRKGVSLEAKQAVADHLRLISFFERHVPIPIEKAKILEIGCGQRAVQTVLFHTDGADAIGIDLDIPTYRMNLSVFIRILRQSGFERALKSFTRHLLFDRHYFSEISKAYGKPIPFGGVDTRVMDATRMAFDSGSFDFIFSRSVLEHVDDVAAAMREINRLLQQNGIAVLLIHLFPCLSGGHNPEWGHPDPSSPPNVPPWDHLRDRRFPADTFLNRFTIGQYRQIFRDGLHILEEQTFIEGEKFLTEEIEEELKAKGYTREDLLTSTLLLCVKKRMN